MNKYWPRLTPDTKLTKVCKTCGLLKPRLAFTRNGRHALPHQVISNCRECCKKKKREYDKSAVGKLAKRHYGWKVRYGMTPAEFEAMRLKQDSRCAICKCSVDKILHVDHDHKTGLNRGLLCGPCNRMIGLADDRPDVLESASTYLKQFLVPTTNERIEGGVNIVKENDGPNQRFCPED